MHSHWIILKLLDENVKEFFHPLFQHFLTPILQVNIFLGHTGKAGSAQWVDIAITLKTIKLEF
jgi:hypothetical protein